MMLHLCSIRCRHCCVAEGTRPGGFGNFSSFPSLTRCRGRCQPQVQPLWKNRARLSYISTRSYIHRVGQSWHVTLAQFRYCHLIPCQLRTINQIFTLTRKKPGSLCRVTSPSMETRGKYTAIFIRRCSGAYGSLSAYFTVLIWCFKIIPDGDTGPQSFGESCSPTRL